MMQIARRLSSTTLFKRVFGAPKRLYSAAAGVAGSDAPAIKEKKKRVSMDQRKAMVESFVDKYRAVNSGKFPTFTCVQKEVGGNYYIIKKLVQELEYHSRRSPTSIRDKNIQQKDITEGFKSSNDSEISRIEMTVHENTHQNSLTRDGTLLVKEAADGRKSLPDIERVSSSQINIDAETHEDTIKGKRTLLRNKVCREDESTEVEKVSRVQVSVDAQIHKDAGFKRDARTSLKTKSARKIKSSTEAEEVLSSQKHLDLGTPEDAETSAVNDVDSDFSKANDELTSNFVEKAILDEIARPSASQGDTAKEIKVKRRQLKEESVGSHSSSDKAQNKLKQQSVARDMLEVDGLKPEAEQPHRDEQLHQAEKPETLTSDLSKEHGDETEPQRKSFMWENLKSFANGIVNIWKRF